MIQGRVSGSVLPQIEDGAGRADLPFWDVRFRATFARFENVALIICAAAELPSNPRQFDQVLLSSQHLFQPAVRVASFY